MCTYKQYEAMIDKTYTLQNHVSELDGKWDSI